MADMFGNITVFHGDEKQDSKPESAMDVVVQGGTLEQIKTSYTTAVRVQKPRDIDKIVSAMMTEADYAGDDWYYSWPVNDKRTGKKTIVEGASIGCAYAIMREWGNCAVDTEYEEKGGNDIFTARFIDIEKGVTQTRIFKQKKKASVGGYDSARFDDMQFQLAQSKAIRNVILAGVPRWLADACVAKAKSATVNMIEKLGIHQARQQACDFFAPYDIDVDQIERLLQKKKDKWDQNDMAQLRGLAKNIKDGHADPQEVFPAKKLEGDAEEQKPEHKKRGPKPKAEPQDPGSQAPPEPPVIGAPADVGLDQINQQSIMSPGVCPDGGPHDGARVGAEYCDAQCTSRDGCPAWEE